MDVLLIDHRPRHAAALRGVMTEAFWQVHMQCVYTVSAAVQAAREARSLDLMVLQLEMPEWRDIEALTHIRSEVPWIRILAVSSTEDFGLAAAALKAGAVGCIPDTLSTFAKAAAIRFMVEADGIYAPSPEFLRQPRRNQVITPPPKQASPS
ncbi:MAG TPA: response regulator [Burkholderiales bacterium]|jgi:DNA-binding NarL/FixJ family response regulator|nr:response regulator [Burkholderiales bacterium]